MGSTNTTLWERIVFGVKNTMSPVRAYLSSWDISGMFHTSTFELLVGPARKGVLEILQRMDSQICGVRRERRWGLEVKKYAEICEIDTETSEALALTDAHGGLSQGSPWAIHAVHVVDELEEDKLVDQESETDFEDSSEGLFDAESDTFFTTIDNPMFGTDMEDGKKSFAGMGFSEDRQIFSVWDNPVFSSFADHENDQNETGASLSSMMIDNPLFEDNFGDLGRRVNILSNPLFEDSCECGSFELNNEIDCGASSYTVIGVSSELPISQSRCCGLGVPESAITARVEDGRSEINVDVQEVPWVDRETNCQKSGLVEKNDNGESGVDIEALLQKTHAPCEFDFSSRLTASGDSRRCPVLGPCPMDAISTEKAEVGEDDITIDVAFWEDAEDDHGDSRSLMSAAIAAVSASIFYRLAWLFNWLVSLCSRYFSSCENGVFWDNANDVDL